MKLSDTHPFSYPVSINSLTSLRFFAAILVVIYHFRERAGYAFIENTALFAKGHLAVDFFFILSGFVLTHVYIGAVREGTFSAVSFIQKRFARIYPLHFVTLVICVVFFLALQLAGMQPNNPARYDFALLPANLLLLHAWGINYEQSFNYPAWSVSAEWFAYLLFPLLGNVLVKAWRRSVFLLICAFGLFFLFYAVAPRFTGQPLTLLTNGYGIFRIFPEFILGMALYRFGLSFDFSPRLVPVHFSTALTALAVLVLVRADDAFFIPVFAFLIFAAASASRHNLAAIAPLHNKVMVYLGEISYSIYMVHAVVYTFYFNGFGLVLGDAITPGISLLIWLVSFPVVILTSMASYHFIEVWGRRAVMRLAPFDHAARRFPFLSSAR